MNSTSALADDPGFHSVTEGHWYRVVTARLTPPMLYGAAVADAINETMRELVVDEVIGDYLCRGERGRFSRIHLAVPDHASEDDVDALIAERISKPLIARDVIRSLERTYVDWDARVSVAYEGAIFEASRSARTLIDAMATRRSQMAPGHMLVAMLASADGDDHATRVVAELSDRLRLAGQTAFRSLPQIAGACADGIAHTGVMVPLRCDERQLESEGDAIYNFLSSGSCAGMAHDVVRIPVRIDAAEAQALLQAAMSRTYERAVVSVINNGMSFAVDPAGLCSRLRNRFPASGPTP